MHYVHSMTWTVRSIAMFTGLMIAGCASAPRPPMSSVWVPVFWQSAKIGEPTTLQITIALPLDKPATISTPFGEVIGSIHPYGNAGKRTYTFVLSPEVGSQNLRHVIVRAVGVQLDGSSLSAILFAP
jgi:hypothetical protein